MTFPLTVKPYESFSADVQGVIAAFLKNARPCRRPVFIHMAGIPGSGKSTLAAELHKALQKETGMAYMQLGFDSVMESMLSYRSAKDRIQAFADNEIPAREAGVHILKALIDQKSNILFDNGATFEKHVELLSYARLRGYRVLMVHADISSKTAQKRAEKRFADGGRYLDPGLIPERLSKLDNLIPLYQRQADYFYRVKTDSPASMVDFKKKILPRIMRDLEYGFSDRRPGWTGYKPGR